MRNSTTSKKVPGHKVPQFESFKEFLSFRTAVDTAFFSRTIAAICIYAIELGGNYKELSKRSKMKSPDAVRMLVQRHGGTNEN